MTVLAAGRRRRRQWRLALGNALLAAWILATVAAIVFALLSWIWPAR